MFKKNNKVAGFYLPDLGTGLIIAENSEAGIELLKFKINTSKTRICIPSENKTASEFLVNEGYSINGNIPRMVISWKPEFVFSRGSGYSGYNKY